MPDLIHWNPHAYVLGFDWGMRRMGVAVGNSLLDEAKPLKTLLAHAGIPEWSLIQKMIQEWRPQAFIVGIPTKIDGKDLYTTNLAKQFCGTLTEKFHLPVCPVDERLTTVEARQQLFEQGGYRKIQASEVDSYAAKLMVEQWFFEQRVKTLC
jgi:putative holliday junction resolvase